MSPTWLEIAVAIILLWVAWRIALLLTPLVLKRIREWRNLPPRTTPTHIRELPRSKDNHGR